MHAKNFIRRFRFPQHLAGAILALSAAFSHAQALTIGVTPGVIADSIQVAAADPRIRKFITLYQQSPAVLAKIDERYAHDKRLYSLPWQKP